MNPEPAVTLAAWQKAVERLAGKTNLATTLTSAEWQEVPLAIGERAFFSARVAEAHRLQETRNALQKALTGLDTTRTRADGTAMTYSSTDAIADLRKLWGAEGDSGQLTDITSYRRLKLINDFQTEQAYSYGRWKQDLEDPEMLDEYPAWEFVRVEPRRVPRTDWWEHWQAAGDAINWEGATPTAMAALKTSPIWAVFSRFGTPYPPFDFNSGMGLRDLDREEAESLGLIPPAWNPETEGPAAIKHFNDNVEASIKDLDPKMRDWLAKAMGNMGEIEGNRIKYVPPTPKHITPAAADSLLEKETRINDAAGGHAIFGRRLKEKLDKTTEGGERKKFLLWAFETVRSGKKVPVERNGEIRSAYAKIFRDPNSKDKGFIVVVDASDHNAFSIYPKDKSHLRKYYGLTNRLNPGPRKRLPARVSQTSADAGNPRDFNL